MDTEGSMKTVAELYGVTSPLEFDARSLRDVRPEDIWTNYDEVTDSLTLFVTHSPVPGVHVLLDDNLYVIVDPDTHRAVGLYVESFEKAFVPAHQELQAVWSDVKQTIEPQEGWSQLLRILALWVALLFSTVGHYSGGDQQPQPA